MNSFNPKTVTIGNQVWMAENLAIDDGDEGICHNPETNEYYYTWDAAMRVAKSIPGWRLPTALEWDEAAMACGAVEKPFEANPNVTYKVAQALKDKLGVKLAGYQNFGAFKFLGSRAFFWTATENSSTSAGGRSFCTDASMHVYDNTKTNNAYSVRLVKDNGEDANPKNTPDALDCCKKTSAQPTPTRNLQCYRATLKYEKTLDFIAEPSECEELARDDCSYMLRKATLADCEITVKLLGAVNIVEESKPNAANTDEALEARIKKLEDGKKAWEDAATANASMLSAYELECKTYKSQIKELENETKHMESLARMNKLLEEQNLAYKKLLETKDAEIVEIRRSTEFYKNYYLEDKEVHRPAMREEVRKLKAKIKEMEG